MKLSSDNPPVEFPSAVAHTFTLPQGIIGFSEYTRAELFYLPDNQPFLWMKLHGPTDSVHFIVLEPGGVIANYAPELFDEDVNSLDLVDSSEALVLNIVTLEQQRPLDATVNLVGPIIVNRRTRSGRQLVIANYSSYGAHHPLVDPAVAADRSEAIRASA